MHQIPSLQEGMLQIPSWLMSTEALAFGAFVVAELKKKHKVRSKVMGG